MVRPTHHRKSFPRPRSNQPAAPSQKAASLPQKSTQSPQKPAQSPPTGWGGGVAQWYDQLVGDTGSEYQREVVFPGVLRFLAIQAGDTVLDVACGQGALCRLFQEHGAEVTGVDSSADLIAMARDRSNPSIQYHSGDARDLAFLPAGKFAKAACVLAIQNIHPIAPVCEGVARVLAPGGHFALVMMHPCFRGPKAASWGWDPALGVQYRRVDRYLLPRKEPIVTHPGSDPDHYTWSFHRPIQAYVRALVSAGFLVDAMEEWASHKSSQPGSRAAAENKARSEIPMFLALRAVKVK